jgi:hypothetical protein
MFKKISLICIALMLPMFANASYLEVTFAGVLDGANTDNQLLGSFTLNATSGAITSSALANSADGSAIAVFALTGPATLMTVDNFGQNNGTWTGGEQPPGDSSIHYVIAHNAFGSTTGSFVFAGIETIVPVPAAAWLFGSALIGLAGIGRQRRA